MKYFSYISQLSILLALIISCKKEEIQPIGFYEVDYYTHPSKDQSFLYYYDDGEEVAGSLDEYMVSVNSIAGTFSEEQLLLLNFKNGITNFPDTLIPYSYFVGLNYDGTIGNPLVFGVNLDYAFNNAAHADYLENEFFQNNVDSMILVKVQYEGLADIYYDPDYEIETIPFTYDVEKNDVLFESDDLNAMYALCWKENKWSDTLSFSLSGTDGNIQEVIQEGYRNTPVDAEGATFRGNNVELNYTVKSRTVETSNNTSGWGIYHVRIKIQNPVLGVISPDDVELSILLSKDDGSLVYTYLEEISATTFEITELPNINSYGTFVIGGNMRLQMTQGIMATDLEIKFKRQR